MLLTHEETIALIASVQGGDEDTLGELVERNTALVKSIIKRFLGRGVDYDDLYQIGCVGLIKAVRNYDPSFGVRFSTYAVPMIAGEVKRYLREDGMVKVSRSLKELSQKAMAAAEALRLLGNDDPTIEEIAAKVEAPAEDVLLAFESARAHLSLFDPVFDEQGDGSVKRIERMESKEQGPQVVDRILLAQMLGELEPKERQLIVMRYFKESTQSEIAKLMGVSQVQISRMESRIIRKLREAMES